MGRSKVMVYGPCGGRATRGAPSISVWAEVLLHELLGSALLFPFINRSSYISILYVGTSLCMVMCSSLCAHVARLHVCYIIADLTKRPQRGGVNS